MNILKLTKEKLDIGAISELVADESCGAISLFAGTTRNYFEDKKVISLEYEAYEPMALKVMTKICDEIRSKWPDTKKIAIFHRLDIVPVKEASVVIAISSPHRQSSLESVQFAIDELKRTVPIWKKELYDNNVESWKANQECSKECKKRVKLDLKNCRIEIDPLPNNIVQITANDAEVKRRINYFIDRKREEIDINNILDFTPNRIHPTSPDKSTTGDTPADLYSCARLDTVLLKPDNSAGHLRVRRVKNEVGPQDHTNYKLTLDKLRDDLINKHQFTDMKTSANSDCDEPLILQPLPIGVAERIKNIESFLDIDNYPAPQNIYERLKVMEDKLLYLETVSPEYRHFFEDQRSSIIDSRRTNLNDTKKIFTVDELDSIINNLNEELIDEMKTEI